MTRSLTRALALALLALTAVPACGKYGPPRRARVAEPAPAAAAGSSAQPVAAPPAGEACEEEPPPAPGTP
jgi:hypothetical protein